MSLLANHLSKIVNPTPSFLDPEDEDNDAGPKLTEKATLSDEEITHGSSSALRRKASLLLLDEDARYAGKKVSRKKLETENKGMHEAAEIFEEEVDMEHDSESDDLSESDDDVIKSDDEEEYEDDLASFKEKVNLRAVQSETSKEFSFQDDRDYAKYGDDSGSDVEAEEDETTDNDSDDDEADEDENEDESGEDQDDDNQVDDETEGGMQQFSKTDVEEEIQKGKATKTQLGIWDGLLEGRIKLQKAVVLSNQLPQSDKHEQFMEEGGAQYTESLKQAQTFLKKLLDQLVHLQTSLLLQNPETSHIVDGSTPSSRSPKQSKSKRGDHDDEDITSESEAGSDINDDQPEKSSQNLKRKIKLADYPAFLAKRHKNFQQYRNDTIQKWYDKTRVSSGKLGKGFSAFEQSALKQIDQILSDHSRLIQRTQLKRSVYKVLGKDDAEKKDETSKDEESSDQLPSREHLKDYDEEIFDDDDFYHQLLRELIERKTTDTNDPVAISRQWLEIQKLRNKTKKNVDRKASKGRKIRYDVHPKMVNFMAPVDRCDWTDEARTELYKSLFGKNYTSGQKEEQER